MPCFANADMVPPLDAPESCPGDPMSIGPAGIDPPGDGERGSGSMPSWMRALALFAVLCGLSLVALRWMPTPADAAPAAQPPGPRVGQCGGGITNTMTTDEVSICATNKITVAVEPQCPVCPGGVHVIFVHIDTPQNRWQEQESRKALQEIERWADRYLDPDTPLRAALVEYDNNGAQTKQALTDRVEQVYAKLTADNSYNPNGAVERAANLARRELDAARRESDDTPCEIVIMYAYTKSHYEEQRQAMLRAAQTLKRDANLMIGCPMEPGSWYCRVAPEMPRERRNYTEYSESGKLRRMVQDEMKDFPRGADVRSMHLTQVLPAGLRYIEESATGGEPEVSAGEEGGTVLTWNWEAPEALQTYTVTYEVKPEELGPAKIKGELTVVDSGRLVQRLQAPELDMEVVDLCPTPTPTASNTPTPPPTPTPTATPLPSATPTATPLPSATPTPSIFKIYLPMIPWDEEVCIPEFQFADAVLVLDMSTSMYRETRLGRSKHEAAIEAARLFVDQLSLEPDERGRGDRVAVVGFNDRAWTSIGLTEDRAAAMAAVDGLLDGVAQGTRLDLALAEGQTVIDASQRRAGNDPVMILLTDGLPNRVPFGPGSDHPGCDRQECSVLRVAEAAKAAGTRVFTIGLGLPDDILRDLLLEAASAPADYYFAPDGEDLAGIYRQIAGRINSCP